MTRYYLDTEFLDDGTQIKLISIALVCEDGRELYFALTEWLGNDGQPDTTNADDWLRENVFNKLPACTCPGVQDWRRTGQHLAHRDDCLWRSREEIAEAITKFITVEPKDQIEIWAYFASYDWVAFCQLFGKMINLPKHFPWLVNDLKTWSRHMGYTGKFRDLLPDEGHHDALADARWNCKVHKILLDRFAQRAPLTVAQARALQAVAKMQIDGDVIEHLLSIKHITDEEATAFWVLLDQAEKLAPSE